MLAMKAQIRAEGTGVAKVELPEPTCPVYNDATNTYVPSWDEYYDARDAYVMQELRKQSRGPDVRLPPDKEEVTHKEQAKGVHTAWVTDTGRWIGCMYADHGDTLRSLVPGNCSPSYGEAEKLGWIHAGGKHDKDCPRHDGKRMTPAQKRKLEEHGYNPEGTEGLFDNNDE